MFCANCGVRLSDTESCCPLCQTTAYHPEIQRELIPPLYPPHRVPKRKARSKAMNGAVLILFCIPLLICLLSDWQTDRLFSWSGYAVGGLCLGYLGFGLPLWFQKPNPVIFIPCDFVAIGVYLLYICLVTHGNWFIPFGLPLLSGLALITCTVVTLLHYVGKGKLYIWGGAFIAMGGWMLLLESLLFPAFAIPFAGWSIYPLIVFVLLGGTLIYLAINRSARETMERKLFF